MNFLEVSVGKDMLLITCLLNVDLYVEDWKFIGIVLPDFICRRLGIFCLIFMYRRLEI